MILLTAAIAAAGDSPSLAGAWQGELVVGSLRVVLRIDRVGSGWKAALDSPDQGSHDIPAASVELAGDQLDVTFPGLNGTYRARLGGDGLRGTWTQNGKALPLALARRAGGPAAAGLGGAWEGVLETKLTFVLHVEHPATGWTATADSPDQHSKGIPVDAFTVAGDQVSFALKGLDASFQGRSAGDRLAGTFTQHGRHFPLQLARTDHPATVRPRPQEPGRPLPYDEIALTVPGGAPDVQLACTLTRPPGRGPFAAVVLVTGSGPQDRDETLMGHKPFLVLSDALTQAGVEVLRCDDRGVAASTGAYDKATTLDFTADALAAVAELRRRPEVERRHIGIVGHSEGSMVAAIAAARSRDVAFIVLLAPPAMSLREYLHLQRAWFERRAGQTESEIAATRAKWEEAYAVVAEEKDDAKARARLRALYDRLPAGDRASIDGGGGFDAIASQLLTPWQRTAMSLDPRAYLARVRVPVLALLGDRDMQVPPDATVPELKKSLAGDRDVTIRRLPGLNHLFQTAQTGGPDEYAHIEETMSPTVLSLVSGWVVDHARR
ncbi:MAG TPA: alpha/beta fold hydrolase [Polyangia bacterium]|nr:alpha/beta fold hydrolase [Polyangia bacterium]